MTPALLARAGAALHGPDFKNPLADDLGVSGSTVRRWCNGREAIPPGIVAELLALLEQHRIDLPAKTERHLAEVGAVVRHLEHE